MKKKYLLRTLLLSVLLLTGGGKLWADDQVIFSMTDVTGPTDAVTSKTKANVIATFTGGSAEVYNGHSSKNHVMCSGSINLAGSGGSYFHATLTTALAAGDIISIGANGNMFLSKSSSKPKSSTTFPYTLTANDALIGATNLYVFKDGISAFATFTVTRPANDKQESSVSFGETTSATVDMATSATFQLPTPTTNPNGLAITYSSDKTSVATVNNTGLVTLISEGTAKITAKFAGNDTYQESSAEFTLTVTNSTPKALSNLVLDNSTKTAADGTTYTFVSQSKNFTITNTNNKGYGVASGSNYVKYSANTQYTINIPSNVIVKSVTFTGFNNYTDADAYISEFNGTTYTAETAKVIFGKDQSIKKQKFKLSTPQTGGTITFTPAVKQCCFSVTINEETTYVLNATTVETVSMETPWKFTSFGKDFIVTAGTTKKADQGSGNYIKYSNGMTYTFTVPDDIAVTKVVVAGRSNSADNITVLFNDNPGTVIFPSKNEGGEKIETFVLEQEGGSFTITPQGGQALFSITIYGEEINLARNIAEFKAMTAGTTAKLILTNATVTAIDATTNGYKIAFLEDATGAIAVKDVTMGLAVGDKLNGSIVLQRETLGEQTYDGASEDASTTMGGVTKTAGTATATNMDNSAATLGSDANLMRYVTLTGVTLSNKYNGVESTAANGMDLLIVNKSGQRFQAAGSSLFYNGWFDGQSSEGFEFYVAANSIKKIESLSGILLKGDRSGLYVIVPTKESDVVWGEDQSLKKVNSIAEFKQLANEEEAELVLTDAYVTYSYIKGLKSRLAAPARTYSNSYQMILEDATGAILFNSTKVHLEKGQKVNGSISARNFKYDSQPVSLMEDMDLTSMDGITSIEEEEITPTEYADVKDLQNLSRVFTKVRVGRSTTTDSDIEGIKELHTGSSMIYLEPYNIFTGETINFPEQLEYVEGFVMGEVESGLERSRSAVRAMTQTATGKIVYYIIPSDFKEYKDLVTDYIADKQTEGDKMLKGDQRKVTGVIMTATEDMPITAEQKTIGEKQFNSKVEGNNFQFDATRSGMLTVYLEKKQKQPVTVAEDGEPMKDFNGITMDGEFIEIPVKAGKTYLLSTTAPTLNLRGFSFADDGTSNGDVARNIATFKALYDGMVPAEATLMLNDAMVTYIKGDNVFVEDASGATVFYKTNIQFYKDQKLNGTIAGISTAEKNMPQLQRAAKTSYKTFKAVKDSATADTITVAETQLKENIARFVKLTDVISTKDKRGFRILADSLGNSVRIEDRLNVFYELPDTLESIEGLIGIDAEGTFYLWPTSKEGVVKKVVEPETPDNPDNPDNPDQPDQPDQPTVKECDVTYAIAEGETHTAGEAVTVSDEDSEEVVTLTFGFAGGADFKAAKKDEGRIEGFTAFTEGNGENGTATSGTTYIISPKYDGTMTVAVVLNANKSFFVEEDGTALADYNGIKADPKYYGTYSFDVKGGSTYNVYCTGSKLGFYGLNYHYTKGAAEEEPELTYELEKTLDFTSATYAADPTIVLASEKAGTAYDTGNKKQQDIFAATAPEEIAGSIAFQAVSNGSGKGWWIRPDQGGLWSYNAGRSAAVLGLTTGYRVVFNCTGAATDIMSLYNANGDPDGPFIYEFSQDGKQYICTMVGDGNIGFCGNKSKGYISSIEIYKPSIEVTVADYTVKYVDADGNELKEATTHQGLAGTAATISETDKEQININGVAYLYDSDDAEGKTINKDGSTVITVKFAAVTNDLAYTVQEVAAGQVVRETKGTDVPGTTIKVPYRRYNVVDGTLYEKGATSKEYNYSFKLNSDNQVEQLAYTATDKTNVIFLTEGEDIEGMTPCTSNNTFIRSSNAGSGYAAEGDVELVTLTAGTYTLTGVLFDAAKNPDSYWQFMAGDTEVANLHNTTNNTHVATQEFTLTETATITITKAGSGSCGIDLIYIQSQDGQVAEKELPLVYSWESPEGTPIETGGKIAYVNGDGDRLNYKNGDYYTICLNGKKANLNDEAASANAGHMVVTLDNPLKENDVIAITAYITKNSSAKSSAYIVFENGTTAESPVYSDEANIHADFGGAITTTTVVVPAEAAGCKTITLTRGQTGTNLFITKLEITREVADPTPEIDPEFVAPDGKYFLANFASELSWGAGNDWGTRASLVKHPEYVTLHKQEDGTYQMETQVSNGGTAYFFNGDYMDNGSPVNLTIKRLGIIGYSDEAETKPVYGYTIANGDNYYGWDGQSTVLGKNLSADSENAVWIIASEEEAIEGLAAATATDPMDATFLILDPNFGRNNRNVGAWTIEASNKNLSGGNNVNNCAESFHSLFTLSQKLSNAPKGLYSLRAQGFYRQDGSDEENLPYFYANDEKQTFLPKTGSENSMNDASVSFASGAYTTDRIYVQVAEDGELTIGAKNEANTELWCIWDNFELFYYGANADIEEAKAADAENDKEELERQKQEMLAQAKIKLDAMKELVESTNVYTEEAYNEYYGQWIAKYEDGTLTTIEAAALQDPSIVTGWHAQITCDNFLLSAWDTNPDFQDAPYYINSWSVEGDNDGTNFRVPFFEYWTGDDNSLGERTMTATMNNIPEGQYNISAWVRVRAKNGYTSPAYGITLQANDGEAVDVCDGAQVNHPDRQQFYLKNASASGTVGKDGVLNIKFNVAADNNISWLAFKNVKFEKVTVDGIDNLRLYEDGKVYNLRGQKVTGTLRPGLYIKNGRKVVIK